MQLKQILAHVDVLEVSGPVDRPVQSVTRDSREVDPLSAFIAVVGNRVDGHDFVSSTEAPVVVVEHEVSAPQGCTVVRVRSAKLALAQFAAALHGFPGRALPVVGITGTNGKTTVATMADVALRSLGWRTGRIGTTGNLVDGVTRPTRFTTPEAPEIQSLLAQMREAAVEAVLMEVTSIGLAQRRVDGIDFELGVFTNLTRDHLDFHGTFEAYREAKARLFRELLATSPQISGHPAALLCGDDPAHAEMGAPSDRWTYGLGPRNDLRLERLSLDAEGLRAEIVAPEGRWPLRSPLVGRHNALNLLAAWGVLRALGVPADRSAKAVGAVHGVPGRLERVPDRSGRRLVVVDYAHTEDALQHALASLRPLTRGRLWVVFGCGGDRDVGKRPRMGQVAEAGADHVVITSDNPRHEDPRQIIQQITAGLAIPERATAIEDRGEAIEHALRCASEGDTVLIAGKGHETYQEIAGARLPFDDRATARAVMEEL